MAYTLLKNLKDPAVPPVVNTNNSNPIFYDEDRSILKMQSEPGLGRANTTKRIMKSYTDNGTTINIYVEIGIIESAGNEIFAFDNDDNMAALPCPPLDDPPGGNYINPST